MKKNRWLLLCITLLLAGLLSAACSQNTAQKTYDEALTSLQGGKYDEAASSFGTLGQYKDASSYAMYCKALSAAENGNYQEGVSAFKALDGFMDSRMLAVYYTGRALEVIESYEAAEEQYRQIPLFRDASERKGKLPELIRQRDYKEAAALQESGRYEEAIEAFTALDGYSDSTERISAIRETINKETYEKAASLEEKGELTDARQLFGSLGNYSDAADRANAVYYKICSTLETEGNTAGAWRGFTELGDYQDAADRAAKLKDEALYQTAMENVAKGKYSLAKAAFEELGTYRDSAEKARLLGICTLADSVKKVGRNIFSFSMNRRMGLINLTDNIDIEPFMSDIESFSEAGLAIASDGSGVGLINEKAETVLPFVYLEIEEGKNGMYTAVRYGNSRTYLFDLISSDGKALSSWLTLGKSENSNPGSKYNSYSIYGPSFPGGVMTAQKEDETWSLLNENGEEILSSAKGIELITRKAENDTAVVTENDGKRLYTTDGKAMDDHAWKHIGSFSDGLAMVQDGQGLYGYISMEDGKLVIEAQYEASKDFSEGLACVSVGGKWGFINTEGTMVIDPVFHAAGSFMNGICAVNRDNEHLEYIDRNGRLVYFKESTYARASALDEEGRYEEAIEAFEALGDYADSAERAVQAREKINLRVYAQAEELEKSGDLAGAAEIFEWLGDYSDSKERAAGAREQINANAYAAAQALEESGQLEEAITAFAALGEYKGSADHALEIRESINNGIYTAATELEDSGRFEEAIVQLQQIPDYKDVSDRITAIEEKIRQRDYNAAAALEEEGKFEKAITAFRAMNGYSDTAKRITAIEEKIRQRDYNAAAALEEEGKYTQAFEAFTALGDYSDSRERAAAVTEKAAEQKRAEDYAAASAMEESGDLENAEAAFAALGDYKDSVDRIASVKEKIRQRDYETAVVHINAEEYDKAVQILTALGDYQDSAVLLEGARTGQKYQEAVKKAMNGNLSEAYEAFTALGEYKDCSKKAEIVGNLSRSGETQQITDGVLIFEFHELWGIANLNTNVITAAKYTSIEFDTNSAYSKYGLLKVFISGGEVNNRNRNAHPNDVYGYINQNGQEIIPCTWFAVSDFNAEGLCSIAYRDKSKDGGMYNYYHRYMFGISDYNGNVITQAQWMTMGSSNNKNWNKGEDYLFDKKKCDIHLPDFIDGRMKVRNAYGYWGYINTSGRVLGEVKWSSIGEFSNGLAKVEEIIKEGYSNYSKYGFINESGEVVGEICWDAVKNFSNGYAAVQQNGLWGFINQRCALVIPCIYEEVNEFSADGLCDVKTTSGTWQVINTAGEVSFFGK